MTTFRPIDLAREHGISAQAVRNYESEGILPPADRTDAGYRVYTDRQVQALRTFLALIPGYGHGASGRIMAAVNRGDVDGALTIVDECHHQLREDRATLRSVSGALAHLAEAETGDNGVRRPVAQESIGTLARRLGITAATLRTWERVGILVPERDRATGYRIYTADDLRDASVAGLLRRGGYPLDHIAAVVVRIRQAGGTDQLVDSLDGWQRRLTDRGTAMLEAAGHLAAYLSRQLL